MIPFVFKGIIWLAGLLLGDRDGKITGVGIPSVQFIIFCIFGVLAAKQMICIFTRKKIIANIALSLISLLSILFICESITGILLYFKNRKTSLLFWEGTYYTERFVQAYPVLGFRPAASKTVNLALRKGNKYIYNACYTTDSLRRRICPVSQYAYKYAIFFGCSYTFGEGVNNEETLPWLFGKKDTSFRTYNYGFGRYGPHQMLALLETNQLQNEVKGDNGFAVYTFINNHVNRAICDMSTFAWAAEGPCYQNENRHLVYKGSFRNTRPWRYTLFNILSQSNIFNYFSINIPFRLSDKDFEFIAEIILAASKEYSRQFGNDNFFVLLYPGTDMRILPFLQKNGLKVLDYSSLFRPSDAVYHIPDDVHPTAAAYKRIAKKLAVDIKQKM